MIRRGHIVVAAALVLVPALAWGLTDAEKCQAGKLKEASKYAACRLKAEAKAVRTGTAPDYATCDERFASKWAKVEDKARGACPSSGDQAAMQAFLTQQAADVTAAIAGAPLPQCSAELAECTDELTTCESELAAAARCGNGAIDAGEDCDGTLNGATCVSLGFAGGVLSCGGCTFDTGGCWAVRFIDNGDGTITDRQTELMWEKKIALDSTATGANPHDADNRYRWSGFCSSNTDKPCQPNAAAAAACLAGVEGDSTGCDECTGGDGTCTINAPAITTVWDWVAELNAASVAGYDDWRVPTRQELEGLLDLAVTGDVPIVDVAFHGESCGAACTDLTSAACSCTQSGFYWSASTYGPDPILAWIVSFVDGGGVHAVSPTNSLYVRAVRSGS